MKTSEFKVINNRITFLEAYLADKTYFEVSEEDEEEAIRELRSIILILQGAFTSATSEKVVRLY